MKKLTLITEAALLCIAVAVNARFARAQGANLLCNGSFEDKPIIVPLTGWSGVPCWFSSGTLPNSGLEPGLPGSDGLWASYSGNSDVAAFGQTNAACSQTTGYVVEPNDSFAVSVLGGGYSSDLNWSPADTTLHYTLYYGGTPTSVGTPFYQGFFDFGTGSGGSLTAYTHAGIAVPSAAIGQVVGISLYNSSGLNIDPCVGLQAAVGYSWAEFDKVILTVSAGAPPAILLTNQWDGSQMTLSWSQGTLLEATNLLGPWTTNTSPSPCMVTPTGPIRFYRVKVQ